MSTKTAKEIVTLLFTASFGLFTAANNGFHEGDTETSLRQLWLDLLPLIGVASPSNVLAHVHVHGLSCADSAAPVLA